MGVVQDRLAFAGASALRPAFTVELSLSVEDADGLWLAAARKGLAQPGATIEELYDVIGPADDPDLAACVAMLAAPGEFAGCALNAFTIVERGRPRMAANDQLAEADSIDASA